MTSPLRLLERQQIRDDLIEFGVGQLHIGHQGALLERVRIADPGAPRGRRTPRGERVASQQLRQVWPELPLGRGAADGVAVDTRRGEEDGTTGVHLRLSYL